MSRPRSVPRRSGAALAALVAVSGGCNLWPGLGSIDVPYPELRERAIERRSLESRAVAPPQSVDDGVEAVRQRRPAADGEPPRAVQQLEQPTVPLTVERMRLLVLQNNLDLDVALYDPALARTRVSQEIGKFDAVIGGAFRYARKDLPPLDGPLVDFTSTDPDLDKARVKLTEVAQRTELLDLGLGVTVPLPTGGKVSVDGLLSQKDVLDPQRFEQYVAATRFSFSQPLLRNAGTDVNLASIRIARVGERISEVRTRLAALRILSRAEKAYWRLYAARRFLDVRAEQFRLASENLELVRARVAQGITPTVEISRAEVGVYKQLQALIEAETSWRLRQRELKTYLATADLPLRGEPLVDIATDPLLAGLELDADALVESALAERLELFEVELGIVQEGIRIGVAENQTLPIANLDFKWGTLERDRDFGSAWTSQWDLDHHELSVGLGFEIPITNQQARARLDGAILSRARALASREARSLAIRQEVYDAVDLLRQNWQRIVAARQQVIVAGVNYDAERRQFEQGLRTMREVLEALSDLGDAQISEIRAITDYQVSQIDVAFATGTLLGYARVDLTPLELPGSPGAD
ncbi:MAG: TolC family protein [Planctomycetes bacterium]|nr:TolC family protein [Planctomycetota bacterium]